MVYDDRAARQKALDQAKTALKGLEEAVPPHEKCLAEAKEARDKALEELSAAQQTQKKGDKEAVAIEAKRAEVQKAFDSLVVLKVVSDGGKQSKLAIKTVTDTGKAFGVDESLVGHAPQALRKEPSVRSDFDKVVIEQLEQALSRVAAGFDASLADAAPARNERAAAAQAAQRTAEAAEQAVADRANEMHQAQEAAKAGAAAVRASQKAVSRWLTESKAEGQEEFAATEVAC